MWHGFTVRVVSLILFLGLTCTRVVLAVPPLEVTFLDVGEGDAIYIRTPQGKTLLVDAANPATAGRIVEFLRSRGVETIHSVFITHPHPDHMGGIFQLLSTFDVERVYDNGQPIEDMPRCDIYRWYVESVRTLGHYRALRRGQTIRYGDTKVEVLWPERPEPGGWNHNSLVLRLTYRGRVFLLMGDALTTTEAELLRREPSLKADVLKAGHHGSMDTLSKEFLQSVSPSYVVISVNMDNPRGYPSREVLERLDRTGMKTLVTHRDGNIGFLVDRNGGLRLLRGQR